MSPYQISDTDLDKLWRDARSQNGWKSTPVTDEQLNAIYDLTKWGPTSANCQPQRIVFVRSQEARERLKPALSAGNLDKTMSAPVTALLAYDLDFHERLPELFPHTDARSWFTGKPEHIEATAFRNATLQAGYFMLAARAVGLDVGAMSGFDNARVDDAFFAGTNVKSNFLCNIGHGDPSKVMGRLPRLEFKDVCTIL